MVTAGSAGVLTSSFMFIVVSFLSILMNGLFFFAPITGSAADPDDAPVAELKFAFDGTFRLFKPLLVLIARLV